MAIIINPKELSASAVFLFTDNMLLLWDNDTMLPDTECLQDFINAGVIDFYFYETGHDYICGSLNIDCKTIHTGEVVPLRTIFENQLFFAARAARAKAILSWKKSVLFCSYCGTRLVDAAEETACDCVQCGRRFYPSLSPAIIV
ncbi:MAG: NADH pyrophosphatase zinc ribbon domain-containing protein, partial [Spirochaetales bacterium]